LDWIVVRISKIRRLAIQEYRKITIRLRGKMVDFITLSCPTCGGKLEITNDIERFACGYCGKELIVRRGGGIVSLAPIVDEIKKLQTGIDKTSTELAITRLKGEIEELNTSFSLRFQDFYRKHETNDTGLKNDSGLDWVGIFAMGFLLRKDKTDLRKVDPNRYRERFFSISDEDIDLLLKEGPRLDDPGIIDCKVKFNAFYEELKRIKDLKKEKDNSVLQKKPNWKDYTKSSIQSEIR
jgi:hypothetical protein